MFPKYIKKRISPAADSIPDAKSLLQTSLTCVTTMEIILRVHWRTKNNQIKMHYKNSKLMSLERFEPLYYDKAVKKASRLGYNLSSIC